MIWNEQMDKMMEMVSQGREMDCWKEGKGNG
jgi:hypothetical protein